MGGLMQSSTTARPRSLHLTEDAVKPVEAELQERKNCALCSKAGTPVYANLRDHTFGAPGTWNYLGCRECGLLWLSPRPRASEMGRFYANYLTHQPKSDHTVARKLYDKFKQALWARALGQPTLASSWIWGQMARISRVDPFVREIGRIGTMHLADQKPGRLLDVGCGNGSFLALMQSAGWQVVGIEPDPKAAKLASERLGVTVLSEQLCDAGFEDGCFDAVTLHHVIEHVHDPIGTMAECRRILKSGGQMTIATPNLSSIAHRLFKADWRGLEPPRHLNVFSPRALTRAAEMAGLRAKLVQTSARSAVGNWIESRVISRRRAGTQERQGSLLGGLSFLAWERAVKALQPEAGEELVFVGTPN